MEQPVLNERAFVCPHCEINAEQRWFNRDKLIKINQYLANYTYNQVLERGMSSTSAKNLKAYKEEFKDELVICLADQIPIEFSVSQCNFCKKICLWHEQERVYPLEVVTEEPNKDMPEEVKDIYLEAVSILNKSPRGAAALIRLALEMLFRHLNVHESTIDKTIAKLQENGLNPVTVGLLDIIRVYGNSAVHIGEIDLSEDKEKAIALLKLLNRISYEMISQKKIDQAFLDSFPEGVKNSIKKRSTPKAS